jgi:hypothetical protein
MVIKLKKKKLILIFGILIGFLWLSLIIEEVISNKPWQQLPALLNQIKPTPTPSPTPIPTPMTLKIRIKYSFKDPKNAEALAQKLKLSGFNDVEIIPETQEKYKNLTIVTKASDENLKSNLSDLLDGDFTLASASASISAYLTDDSDFRAVLLFGGK